MATAETAIANAQTARATAESAWATAGPTGLAASVQRPRSVLATNSAKALKPFLENSTPATNALEFQRSKGTGDCCAQGMNASGVEDRADAPGAPAGTDQSESRGGPCPCNCDLEDAPIPPPAPPASLPGNTNTEFKGLSQNLFWLIAGKETFERNLQTLGSIPSAVFRNLCRPAVPAVERRKLLCAFQI